MCLTSVYSKCSDCLFMLLLVSFKDERFLILVKSNLIDFFPCLHCTFGILFKKFWPNPGLQIISSVFSSKSLIVLALWLYTFGFIVLDLFWINYFRLYEIYIQCYFFNMNIQLWPVTSVEWIVFSLPYYLKSVAYIGVCLFLESPVPLRYLPIFTSVPYCHEHSDFISLKNQIVFFGKLVLPILGFLHVYMNFRIGLSVFTQKSLPGFLLNL